MLLWPLQRQVRDLVVQQTVLMQRIAELEARLSLH